MSDKANDIKEIGPVESIDLWPISEISKTDIFDVWGLKHSILLQEYDSLCQSRPLNCSIVNVIKNLLNVNPTDEDQFKNWDKDTDVDF